MSDIELDLLVGDLNRELFGTSYKAHAWTFDIPQDAVRRENLDLSVSAAELRSGLKLQEERREEPEPTSSGSKVVVWLGAAIAGAMFLRTRRRLPLAVAIVLRRPRRGRRSRRCACRQANPNAVGSSPFTAAIRHHCVR